jgi:hypothetical protein
MGEPGDISLGGLRVRNLPARPHVQSFRSPWAITNGSRRRFVLARRSSPSWYGGHFGVEFRDMGPSENRGVIKRLPGRAGLNSEQQRRIQRARSRRS